MQHVVTPLCHTPLYRLDQALNVLELELKVKGQEAEAAEGEAVWLRNQNEAITSIFHASIEESTENPYIQQFLQFFNWADGSLDIYKVLCIYMNSHLTFLCFFFLFSIAYECQNMKTTTLQTMQPELMRLLYLTMIYTYLHLVSLGEGPLATSMLADCKTVFLAGLPPAHKKLRESELSELSSITTAEQLETSSLARAVRSRRAPLKMSRPPYNLTLHFLRQNELTLILALINQWIEISVVDVAVIAAATEETVLLAGLTGIGVDGDAINQTQIDLRLLKDSAAQKHAEAKAIKAEEEAAANAETDTATKKQKAALVKAAEQAKQKKDAVCANSITSSIPLLPLPEEGHTLLMEDLKIAETAGAGAKPVSASALPSAAFLTFVNTKQSLNCVAVSNADDAIAAGYSDSTVRIHDLKTHGNKDASTRCVVLSGHTAAVHAADFSPDDQLIVSSSADGTARMWSSEYSMCIAVYRGHMLPVWDATFSPEYAPYFATGGADRVARVWTTERTHALRILCGHKGDVDVVRWHPNCQYIATGSSDKTVRLWDVKAGGCVRVFEGHKLPVGFVLLCIHVFIAMNFFLSDGTLHVHLLCVF